MPHTFPLRILVAEDDRVSAIYLCKLLEKNGHLPKHAKNGNQVLKALENEYFDIVLMDIQMPEVDGLEATRRIRNSEDVFSSIPIIGVSANQDPPARDICKDSGMNYFIPKPISMSLFEEALWQIRNKSAFAGPHSH
ncbi:MAG: response regulator [Pseudodesulfovibrio sp.]|nr:response regulator [Pseudodesulfovibrio sp.]